MMSEGAWHSSGGVVNSEIGYCNKVLLQEATLSARRFEGRLAGLQIILESVPIVPLREQTEKLLRLLSELDNLKEDLISVSQVCQDITADPDVDDPEDTDEEQGNGGTMAAVFAARRSDLADRVVNAISSDSRDSQERSNDSLNRFVSIATASHESSHGR